MTEKVRLEDFFYVGCNLVSWHSKKQNSSLCPAMESPATALIAALTVCHQPLPLTRVLMRLPMNQEQSNFICPHLLLALAAGWLNSEIRFCLELPLLRFHHILDLIVYDHVLSSVASVNVPFTGSFMSHMLVKLSSHLTVNSMILCILESFQVLAQCLNRNMFQIFL